MKSSTSYSMRIQNNLAKLASYLQPKYLIHTIAIAGIADIALNSMSGNLVGAIGALGGSVGVEMLGHFLSKLDKDEAVGSEFVESFCEALDKSDIENWLTRTDLRDELERIAHIIGTVLQYHENTVINKVLSGIAYYESLRTTSIKQLHEDVIHLFDPEKRFLTRLIHRLEARDGVIKYVELKGNVNFTVNNHIKKLDKQRRVIDPAFERRPSRTLNKELAQDNVSPVQDIRNLIDNHKIFALLGDPGSGKSTTLKRMVVDMAWKRLQDNKAPIPFYLELPEWKDGDLNRFLTSNWELDIDLNASIVGGKVWIFLDGLNEMGALGYQRAEELRNWLRGRNHPEYLVVSCRSGDYEDPFKKDQDEKLSLGITTARINPLNDPQIRDFATKYLSPDELEGFLTYIASFDPREDDYYIDDDPEEAELQDEKSLSKFTRNPFMLRGLTLLYKEISIGELPRNIGALLEELIKYLWDREHNRETIGWIDYQSMLNQLSQLAYHMIEAEIGTSVAISIVEDFVSPDALPAMERANLIELYPDSFRFYHQLMQEYFAAVILKEMYSAKGQIPTETIEPPNEWHFDLRAFDAMVEWGTKSFKSMYPYESKWKQVVIALCGIVIDVNTVIQQIADTNPFMVVDCAQSGIELSSETYAKVVHCLKSEILQVTYLGERLWFADELRRYGFEPKTIEDKVIYHAGLMDWQIIQELGDSAIPTLLKLARQWDYGDYYAEGILLCLQKLIGSLPSVLEHNLDFAFDYVEVHGVETLQDLIVGLNHWRSDVRATSAELVDYLASNGFLRPSKLDVVPELIKCLEDPSWFVAQAAANALWKIGTKEAQEAYKAFWKKQYPEPDPRKGSRSFRSKD